MAQRSGMEKELIKRQRHSKVKERTACFKKYRLFQGEALERGPAKTHTSSLPYLRVTKLHKKKAPYRLVKRIPLHYLIDDKQGR